MRSKFLLFVVPFLVGMGLRAENVTIQQAKKAALNFYIEQFNRFEGTLSAKQVSIRSVFTSSESDQQFYHVFNMLPAGFVMVSSENRLNPILGYSFTNDFGFKNQPPNVKWWLQQYVDQVKYVRAKQLVRDNTVAEKWDHYLNDEFITESSLKEAKEVEPLLTTEWDQDWSYNFFCPFDTGGPGGHAYAGCGATAMGQILFYWRWPDHGNGFHCYTPQLHPEYGEQCADFENTYYRWDEMDDEPTEQPINTAIAELLYHNGVSIDMDYNTIGGSAPAGGYYAPVNLEYFRCSLSYQTIYFDSVDIITFRETLRTSLDEAKPIVYCGGSENYSTMHAFVCDGYQDSLYFNFNMGWSGISNGYYLVDSVLDLTAHQYYYSGVMPDTLNNTYPLYETGPDSMNALNGSITDGSGPLHNYLNNTQASWLIDPQTEFDSVTKIIISVKRFDLFNDGDRLYIYDGENNSAPLLAELSGNSLPGNIESSGNKVFIEFITDGSNTAPGFYLNYKTIRPVWCTGMTQMTSPAALFDDGSGSFSYYNSTTCTWMINPGITEPLTLHFNYFDTEENHDMLKVYDAGSQTLLAEISGFYANPPEPVTSPSGKMMLAFLTNNNTQGQGWEVWYDINTEIPDNPKEAGLSIIPNPSNDKIAISIPVITVNTQVSIFNVSGVKVLESQLNDTETQLDISALPPGVYFVRVQNEMIVEVGKIVKE